jgi:HlyD family secretion protein
VKNAEAAVKWFETVDGPQMLKQTELQVKAIKDNVEDQNDELDQLRKMYNTEDLTTATSDIVIKRSVRQLDRARIMHQMTEQRAEKLKQNEYPIAKQRVLDALEQARQGLEMLKVVQAQSAVTRKAGLVAARIAKEQAENKLKDIKEDLALFSIKSPADGVVAYGQVVDGAWQGGDPKAFKPGEKLAAGATVMRVIAPGKLNVEMSLTEAQAFWLDGGAKARVTPAAFPTLSYEGTVGAPTVAPKASALGFQVTIALPDADARLLPGMKALVKIEGPKKDPALLVPLSAVSDGKVTVKKDGKTEEKPVKLGRSDGTNAEVVSGLSEGDEVVVKK